MKRDEIHIWRCELGSAFAKSGTASLALLDAGEQARAAGFRHRPDRERYIASHAFLRQVLSRYVGVPAGRLVFGASRYGKPALVHPSAPLAFSLSHSGDIALVAVSGATAVGVDIEQARNDVDILAVAPSVLSPEEHKALLASDIELQRAFFYRAWVSKEALLKACGIGLSIAPQRLAVLTGASSDSLIELNGTPWGVRGLELGDIGYFAAVAAPGERWTAILATAASPTSAKQFVDAI